MPLQMKNKPKVISFNLTLGTDITDEQKKKKKKLKLTIRQVSRLKHIFSKIRDKNKKIYYYDTGMETIEFEENFKFLFKTIGMNYIREQMKGMDRYLANGGFK